MAAYYIETVSFEWFTQVENTTETEGRYKLLMIYLF